ncbi:methyl-accepting chemotaxis protein [Desulfosediminicola flagellatus]|uniref:methyl-accepting chemotaxis protein n=1 Tax=Desulfosediminicola flagellatus TaxID=2569541 RepID=UPI0010AB7EE9|nr:methyl-accepting chemotaxis protein [Desulfosediminicola flagellatus]
MASKMFRKQLIVDNIQYKFMAIILIYVLVTIIISGLMMFLPSIIELSSGEATARQQRAAQEILLMHKRFWPALIVVLFFISAHSMLIFHRIFGPLYRFRGIFKMVKNGDLSVVAKIRKNDFLHTEEIAIREMITSLKINVAAAKSNHNSIHISLGELEQELQDMDLTTEEIREKLVAIQQKSSQLEKDLNYFQT